MQDNVYNQAPASVPVPVAPQSEQHNPLNKKFYIILTVMAVIIIGLAIAVICLAMMHGKESGPESGGDAADEGQHIDDNSISALRLAQRDAQRTDDLEKILVAVNSYQANNMGKTPWNNGYNDPNFVHRYIDETCDVPSNPGKISVYHCTGSSFMDPSGKAYSLWYLGSMTKEDEDGNLFDGDLAAVAEKWPNDYMIMVATGAACGDEGKMEKWLGERQYAVAYRLERGYFACRDNR